MHNRGMFRPIKLLLITHISSPIKKNSDSSKFKYVPKTTKNSVQCIRNQIPKIFKLNKE